jgi:antitoxin VapB
MTEAVTTALRERARRAASAELPAGVAALAERLRAAYDTRPVSRAEWDAAAGDA